MSQPRLRQVDPFTADTLREMLKYQPDDRKIAQHLDIDERYVRIARARKGGKR